MSARFVDALKGYEFFLSVRGKADIKEINRHLKKNGRAPIRPRTFVHYQKLLDKGFRSYVPINKFDVFESLGRLQLAADRRKYSRDAADLDADISRDGASWASGKLIDRSMVGLGLLIPGRYPASVGSPIWVRLPIYNDIPCFVVWRRYEKASTRIGLRALEFVANFLKTQEQIDTVRLRGTLTVTRSTDAILNLQEFVRLFQQTHALIEAATSLLYTVSDSQGGHLRLARAVVVRVRFGSPGEGQFKVDLGIAELIKVVLDKVQYWGLEKMKLRQETRKLELENANLEIETVRNAINLRRDAKEAGLPDEVIPSLLEPVRKALALKELPQALFEPRSPERAILSERLLPAAADLVAGDDPDVHIDIDISE